jgi:uroporphyrin-III C-methyltransferase
MNMIMNIYFYIQGVSAAFAAPLLGSIPVTHRGVANQVVMCTGYGREGSSPDLIQYHPEQTIVFLMAVGRLQQLCDKLQQQAHYPCDTPVAIVERAGCPNQRTIIGTMTTISDLAIRHKVQPPSTIIVGDVVNVLLQPEDIIDGQYITNIPTTTATSSSTLSSTIVP